jgi:hypothetical protein
MQSKATSPEGYIDEMPAERRRAFAKLRSVIKENLPKGFKEGMGYGMMGWSVPHSVYPPGYHCNPKDPLPFMSIASQKNFIAVYHMGVYADPALLKWFTTAHAKTSNKRLDMGKSCIRYKDPGDIPFELIGELASKITPEEWIAIHEKKMKR